MQRILIVASRGHFDIDVEFERDPTSVTERLWGRGGGVAQRMI